MTDNLQKLTFKELQQRQSLPLHIKIKYTEKRIIDYYNHFQGNVHLTFSGGLDSTVLLDIARKIFKYIPAVFVDTGLEYPEIKEFVNTINDIIWMRPKIPFARIIEKHGYPCVSKSTSRYINDVQNPTDFNKDTRNLRLTGYDKNGKYRSSYKIPDKWLYLIEAPFKISDKCCDIIKKEPLDRYARQFKSYPITAVLASESARRTRTYLQYGCNLFNAKKPISMPMAFWLKSDVLEYIKQNNLPYSKIYDMGEKRTGCMFCMFGVHLEKGENRFQRMRKSHPKEYRYCIEKLGIGKVLDFIGVKFK